MAKHGARAQHAVLVIHIEVAARLRMQFAHPAALILVFRHMRLQIRIRIGARQLTCQVHLFIGRGGHETGRDRVQRAAMLVPAPDQLFAFAGARLGRVAQELRAIAIHHDLARHHAQAARFAGAEEGIDRLRMHAAIHHGRGGTAAQQFIEEKLRHIARVDRVFKRTLGGEGVRFQPWQQTGRGRGDHFRLREMQMRVDKAGHDQLAPVIDDMRARRQSRLQLCVIAGRHDLAIGHDQQSVRMPGVRLLFDSGIGVEVQQAGTVGLQCGRYNQHDFFL